MGVKSVLKTSTLGVAALFAMSMATTGVSYADTFTLTSCHISGSTCQGGSIPAPGFGSVTLTQVGANVNFSVSLANGSRFVETGAGGGELFLFNDAIAGSTITGITSAPNTPAGGLSGFTNLPPVMADGTGTFTASVECTVAGDCNGGSAPTMTSLAFTVTNATLAQLEVANAAGNIFVADILCGSGVAVCGGLTGPVDVTGAPSAIPLPGALPLFLTGLGGLFLIGRRKKQATASAT